MGYYTNYTLSIAKANEEENKQFDIYMDSGGSVDGGYLKLKDLVYGHADSTEWYDYHDNMLELSKKYPSILFQLNGNGEENGDQWIAWFQNGKSMISRAKITFDPYDKSKMK